MIHVSREEEKTPGWQGRGLSTRDEHRSSPPFSQAHCTVLPQQPHLSHFILIAIRQGGWSDGEAEVRPGHMILSTEQGLDSQCSDCQSAASVLTLLLASAPASTHCMSRDSAESSSEPLGCRLITSLIPSWVCYFSFVPHTCPLSFLCLEVLLAPGPVHLSP